jgi:tetratricopeptide (TPR) repeat protein
MNLFKNRQTRVLIIIIGTLVVFAVGIAAWYYKYQNTSIDPRVVKAHDMYEKYNELTMNADYEHIFLLMDSIELIYSQIEHYKTSYEVGVLYNNKAAAYIAMALDSTIADTLYRDSLFALAEKNIIESIEIYIAWISHWENKTKDDIQNLLIPHFSSLETNYNDVQIQRFINKRTKQIIEAQIETPRRLSVSYTNLGIIYRHRKDYNKAAELYLLALDYWADNLAAENNLNVLLGKDQKKRSLLRKIFPKDRIE